MYYIILWVLIPTVIVNTATLSPQQEAIDPLSTHHPGSCLIPDNPPNGEYTIGNTPVGTFKTGSYISPFSVLTVICQRYHKPSPPDKAIAICVNGEWSAKPAKCSRSCTGINSTTTTKVSCKFMGRELESCIDAVDDTLATIKCETLFEDPGVQQNPLRVCRDGSWDRPFPQCSLVCGIYPETASRIIPNAIPWHVGIYDANTKQHICGGSIINERTILSAAHCFTDITAGDILPKENYLIAAGKYYRKYDDARDSSVQYASIQDIHIPMRYKAGVSNYEADLAVVVLTNKLKISPSVMPVCVDWNTASEYKLATNNRGVVFGWGPTVDDAQKSEELKKLDAFILPYEQCYEAIPKSFRRYLTHDKICSGYTGNATGSCYGDIGGGLAVVNDNNRYYIRGIVSVPSAAAGGTCTSYQTSTLISKHIEFIKVYAL